MPETYYVQVLVVREVLVEATDELQAEREAYRQLPLRDKGAAIAIRVLDDEGEAGGALAYDDTAKNWRFAREHFEALNLDWVSA